ncbi:MAG TPA: UDP-N-acetylglucosamine 2-epimerase (non-hydrolyzing), partial [Ignavibacteria bacterium]|nr:UDP-N-acetylglucosamine 2-epimerase (non-hydrolyzing) [Ignavibacteria bacterium]
VGARPNFMKMAPIHKKLLKNKSKVIHKIVHTGQHYDNKMSGVFIKELDLPKPHIYLGVGSASHAEQKARIMIEFEKILLKEKPDLVLVYGDINSTAAAALVSSKILTKSGRSVPVAHIESGLRSNDRSMPEEINRLVTDVLSDFFFVTEYSGVRNLLKEGADKRNIFFAGNTMIDSLVFYLTKAQKSGILKELCISEKQYALVTLHRPSNVDVKANMRKIISVFENINKINPSLDIVFPVHPRTLKMIGGFGLESKIQSVKNLIITEPFGYFDFLKLTSNAKFILTDSGGIQEESTYLRIPCLTLRENTERPVTSELGTNVICGLNEKKIVNHIKEIENGSFKKGKIPELWDGKAAERIVKILLKLIK